MLCAAPANGAPSKVWVSNAGVDNNMCGAATAPCRTFNQAFTNVATGGEIGVLTPGDYGSLIITVAVSITNDGSGEAMVTGFRGIEIGANVGHVISLRGLLFDGFGTQEAGIDFHGGSALHVQNCVIRNFNLNNSGFGIFASAIGTQHNQLFVSDTLIYNNGSTAGTGGIMIRPFASSSISVVLDRVHLENNVVGLFVTGTQSTGNGAHVIIRDSVVSGNAGDGILATSAPGKAAAFIVVERTASVNNAGTGIHADGPHATVLLDGAAVTRNGVGISATNSGQLISYGNNKVNNNLGVDGTPTGSYSPI
jgi:hypothetical protein